MIVCDAVDELPQPSVAVHVLVTLYDPAHAPVVVTSLKVSVAPLPHASVAVAVAKLGVAGQLMVDVAGSAAITGASNGTCIAGEHFVPNQAEVTWSNRGER